MGQDPMTLVSTAPGWYYCPQSSMVRVYRILPKDQWTLEWSDFMGGIHKMQFDYLRDVRAHLRSLR